MKSVLVILSAAVCAGLGCYFTFAGLRCFALTGTRVLIHVDAFIAFVTSLSLVAAALAIVLRAVLARGEEKVVRLLEHRIATLEGAVSQRSASEGR